MRLLPFVLLLLLTGCFTTSDIYHNTTAVDRTLFVSQHYSGYEERHLGEVVRAFERHGFTITNDVKQAAYQLDFRIDGGVVVTASIVLMKGKQKLINVESTNTGWGTGIARPLAIAGRVSAALEELNDALSTEFN